MRVDIASSVDEVPVAILSAAASPSQQVKILTHTPSKYGISLMQGSVTRRQGFFCKSYLMSRSFDRKGKSTISTHRFQQFISCSMDPKVTVLCHLFLHVGE